MVMSLFTCVPKTLISASDGSMMIFSSEFVLPIYKYENIILINVQR